LWPVGGQSVGRYGEGHRRGWCANRVLSSFEGVFVFYCIQVCSVSHTAVGGYAMWRPFWRVFSVSYRIQRCMITDTLIVVCHLAVALLIVLGCQWGQIGQRNAHLHADMPIPSPRGHSGGVSRCGRCIWSHTPLYAKPYSKENKHAIQAPCQRDKPQMFSLYIRCKEIHTPAVKKPIHSTANSATLEPQKTRKAPDYPVNSEVVRIRRSCSWN
jgi:hypothetical protein